MEGALTTGQGISHKESGRLASGGSSVLYMSYTAISFLASICVGEPVRVSPPNSQISNYPLPLTSSACLAFPSTKNLQFPRFPDPSPVSILRFLRFQ